MPQNAKNTEIFTKSFQKSNHKIQNPNLKCIEKTLDQSENKFVGLLFTIGFI